MNGGQRVVERRGHREMPGVRTCLRGIPGPVAPVARALLGESARVLPLPWLQHYRMKGLERGVSSGGEKW